MFPYSTEAFFAFLEQYNRSIWSAQIFAVLLALIALWLVLRPSRISGRIVGVILTLAWLWCGGVYYLMHLWTIDFVAPGFALLMIMQGLILGWTGAIRGDLTFRWRPDPVRQAGMALAGVALVYDPVLAVFSEHGWTTARVVGLTPGPTMLFTVAVFAMCERVAVYLLAIPILWSGSAIAFAWFLGITPDLVLPLAGIGLAASILWRRYRAATV
ncbi:MAG: DUF6064 family protein [Dongiaceae bacterium]